MYTLPQLLETSPLAFTIVAGVVGLMVGSFLNVVIHRLPIMMERAWRQQCAELSHSGEDQPESVPPYNLVVP
ncbi:MAG: prepilin peptidase, partial [Gallionella sp.]